METEVILFTSLKGGSGKTIACAGVAAALAKTGKRVLALPLDRYSASMELFFGMESSFVLDVCDYPENSLDEICLIVPSVENLSLATRLPFSDSPNTFSETDFLKSVASSGRYDLIIVDKGEGGAESIVSLSKIADRTVVVSTRMNDSVQAAELLACILHENGISSSKICLLLNSFYTDLHSVGKFMSIDGIIDRSGLSLLGIIPFSDVMHMSQSYVTGVKDPALSSAFSNVGGRLLGKDIKLLDFLPMKNRRKLLNN